MNSDSKKQKVVDWTTLPYVIIIQILNEYYCCGQIFFGKWHSLDLKTRQGFNITECYGYFSRDYSKTIYKVFSSFIGLDINNKYSYFPRKLHYLMVGEISKHNDEFNDSTYLKKFKIDTLELNLWMWSINVDIKWMEKITRKLILVGGCITRDDISLLMASKIENITLRKCHCLEQEEYFKSMARDKGGSHSLTADNVLWITCKIK